MENANIELIRGHMDTIILRTMQDADKYGLEILNEIRSLSDDLYSLKQPTLYSSLKRLEKQGLIESYPGTETNGANRTYYKLTEQGKKFLEADQKQWEFSRTIIDKLLSDKEFDKENDTAPFDVSEFRPATKREKREKPAEPQIIYKYIRVYGDQLPENVSPADIVDNIDGISKEDIIDSPMSEPRVSGEREEIVAECGATNDGEEVIISPVATQEYKSVQEIQSEVPTQEQSEESENTQEAIEQLYEQAVQPITQESYMQDSASEQTDTQDQSALSIEEPAEKEDSQYTTPIADVSSDYQNRSIDEVNVESAESLGAVCDIDIKDDAPDFADYIEDSAPTPSFGEDYAENANVQREAQPAVEEKPDLYTYTRDYSNDYYTQTHPRKEYYYETAEQDEYFEQDMPKKKTSRDLNINNDADYVSMFDGAYDEDDKTEDIDLDNSPHSSTDYYEVDKYYNEADMNVLKTDMKEQGINLRPYFKNNTASFYSGNFYYSNKLLRDWSLASYIMYALFVLISYGAGFASGVQLSWTIGFLFAGLVLPVAGFVIWKLSPKRKKRTKFNLTTTLLSSIILLIAMVVVVVLVAFFGIKIDISKPIDYIPALVVPCLSTIMIPLSVFIYALLYKQKHYRVG